MQIQANGIQLNYDLSGQSDAPVVMLSHSLACAQAMWQPQLDMLQARYQVLNYDMRGHGASEAPAQDYNLDQLADDAVGLMDALGIEKVHWVGLSIGGMIGQSLALRHRDRLHSVSLCDTMSVIPEGAGPIWQERIDTVRQQGMAGVVEATLQRWFTAPYLQQKPPLVEQVRELILTTPVDGFVGCCRAISQLNYIGRLNEIDLPTLIIVGKEDMGTPVAASEAIHERISGSQLVILDDASHLSNIEQAQAFNQALSGFLAQHA